MYCVKCLDPLRGKFGFFEENRGIRLRQGYGVTGYADATDGLWDGIRPGGRPTTRPAFGARPSDFVFAGKLRRVQLSVLSVRSVVTLFGFASFLQADLFQ